MFSNVFKCIQMFSNVSKCFQMFSNVFKCFQMFSNVSKCFQRFSNVFKCFQMFSNVFKCFDYFNVYSKQCLHSTNMSLNSFCCQVTPPGKSVPLLNTIQCNTMQCKSSLGQHHSTVVKCNSSKTPALTLNGPQHQPILPLLVSNRSKCC